MVDAASMRDLAEASVYEQYALPKVCFGKKIMFYTNPYKKIFYCNLF